MPDAGEPAQRQGRYGGRHLQHGSLRQILQALRGQARTLVSQKRSASERAVTQAPSALDPSMVQMYHPNGEDKTNFERVTCRRMTSGEGIHSSSIASSHSACISALSTRPTLLGRRDKMRHLDSHTFPDLPSCQRALSVVKLVPEAFECQEEMGQRGLRLWDRMECDPLIMGNCVNGLAASKCYHVHMEASLQETSQRGKATETCCSIHAFHRRMS